MSDRPPLLCRGRYLEIYDTESAGVCPRVAVFDFDGTLSLIRSGWQDVMLERCVEILGEISGASDDAEDLRSVCNEFITRLTGQQTIYQMLHLRREVQARGGVPLSAQAYKADYLDRLHQEIAPRLAALRARRASPSEYLVPGSFDLLGGLRDRDVTCYLASGTDQPLVEEEAALLELAPYFEGGIHGAQEAYWTFSKKKLIASIIADTQLKGREIVVFGDGYVEIENGSEVGAVTVGIAGLETGDGGWDERKRARLLEVGAQILVPDWREADELLAYLYGEDL
jgi:phosphoglycolate phosphatase-like HAD superfamily hydrolase